MNNEIKEIPQIDATLEYSLEDFMEAYKIVDENKVYSNGIEFVPIFRVKQWLDYNNITNLQQIEQEHQRINGELREENKRLKKQINDAIKCINYYSTENEDYSKIYNLEEKELLNILKGDDKDE